MMSFKSLIPYRLHDAGQIRDDLPACERLDEVRRADLPTRRRAREHQFQHVLRAR